MIHVLCRNINLLTLVKLKPEDNARFNLLYISSKPQTEIN